MPDLPKPPAERKISMRNNRRTRVISWIIAAAILLCTAPATSMANIIGPYEYNDEYLKQGFVGYIIKPLKKEMFIQKIIEYSKRKE